MDGIGQVGIPVLGIIAAAALTFYAVSFAEIREKSFRDSEQSEEPDDGGFRSSLSSRQRRAKREAAKKQQPKS